MKIEILEFVEGARKAKGLTVIIDVFRAFSTACYAYDAGASGIIAVGEVNEAFELKKRYKNSVLVGERDEMKIIGFDYGNSPTEFLTTKLEGKIVVQTTSAGTSGLVNATNADILITGSFVNAGAVVNYIRLLNPQQVSLVAMGYRAKVSADEDLLCARLIEDKLKGNNSNFEESIMNLKSGSGKRFFLPSNLDFSPPTDFFLCTLTNKFNFVLRAEKRNDGYLSLNKTDL